MIKALENTKYDTDAHTLHLYDLLECATDDINVQSFSHFR